MWRMIIGLRLRREKVRISNSCLRAKVNEEILVAILEKHAALQSPSQIESLVKIFVHATKVCGCNFSIRLGDLFLTVDVDGNGLLEYG